MGTALRPRKQRFRTDSERFALLGLLALLAACGRTPAPPPPAEVVKRQFRLSIIKPANRDKVELDQPFDCLFRLEDLTGGSPLPQLILELKKNNRIHHSDGSLPPDPSTITPGQRQFDYPARMRFNKSSTPGLYTLEAYAMDVQRIWPTGASGPSVTEVFRFHALPVRVEASAPRRASGRKR